MAHVLAEAPAPPVRAPTPAPQPKPRIYEGHAIDAALEQRLTLDAKRKNALDKREALIIRALAAVKRREDAVAERERRLDARTEALDRRERLLRAREDSEARRAKRLEDATMSADPRLPEIAKRLEAVEKLVHGGWLPEQGVSGIYAVVHEDHLVGVYRDEDGNGRPQAVLLKPEELAASAGAGE